MTYHQFTPRERYMLAALRRQGCNQAEIARQLGRHRSTVCREVRRNSTRADGRYRAFTAQERTNGRRSRSRRNSRFTAADFALVDGLLCRQWSPEQVAGHLCRTGQLAISHETIYRHVWRDKRAGGTLLVSAAGSGFSDTGEKTIGMTVWVDGENVGTAQVYTNEKLSHKAFVPTFEVVNGVPKGPVKIELKPLNGDTKTDQNDFFRVTVEEQPRG